MKMMANMLSKKEDKNDAEEGMEQSIKSSYDIKNEKYTQPLIDYLMK
jgi:hypothetical protein